MSKHTPTPWSWRKAIGGADTIVGVDKSTPVASVSNKNGHGNIEFIVRACNMHDELVAALEVLLDDALDQVGDSCYCEPGDREQPPITCSLCLARAALAKAKGE